MARKDKLAIKNKTKGYVKVMILIISLALACSPEEKAQIFCDASCIVYGDKKGIIVGNICGCWNPKGNAIKLKKVNGKVIIDEKKTFFDD